MSYNFDGKLANQSPVVHNLTSAKTLCSKCSKLIDFPIRNCVTINDLSYFTFNYLGTAHFLHETKSGRAVAYCSDYCRRKHNHRFARKSHPKG
jgi:hypothetical protein